MLFPFHVFIKFFLTSFDSLQPTFPQSTGNMSRGTRKRRSTQSLYENHLFPLLLFSFSPSHSLLFSFGLLYHFFEQIAILLILVGLQVPIQCKFMFQSHMMFTQLKGYQEYEIGFILTYYVLKTSGKLLLLLLMFLLKHCFKKKNYNNTLKSIFVQLNATRSCLAFVLPPLLNYR